MLKNVHVFALSGWQHAEKAINELSSHLHSEDLQIYLLLPSGNQIRYIEKLGLSLFFSLKMTHG